MEGAHREEGFQLRRDANFILSSGEKASCCLRVDPLRSATRFEFLWILVTQRIDVCSSIW